MGTRTRVKSSRSRELTHALIVSRSLSVLAAPGPSPFLQADFELKEITHCRLAMLAFSGMVTQAVLYQGGFPYTG